MKLPEPFFMTNPDWYETGEDGIGYILTDKAPEEARKSYEDFYQESDFTIFVDEEKTFERICKKLGFNPIENPPTINLSGYEDDSKESPYTKLTIEESDFLCDYMRNHMK